MTVKQRLYLLAATGLLAVLVLISVSLFSIGRLAALQDEAVSRAHDETMAEEASSLGIQLYQIIADTIINRNVEASHKDFLAMAEEARSDIKRLAERADTDAERRDVQQAGKDVEALVTLYEKRLLPALNAQNELSADIRALDGDIDKSVSEIRKLLKDVEKSMAEESNLADRAFDETQAGATRNSIIIGVLTAIVLMVLATLIIRSIIQPLNEAEDAARRIANGDLTRPVNVGGPAELQRLLQSCDSMQKSLREMVKTLQDNAESVASMSSQLAATTGEISVATDRQSEASASMAASMEEMSVSISHMSDHAREVKEGATQSAEVAANGQQIIEKMLETDRETSRAISDAEAKIVQLGSLSGEVSSIVKVIRDVADQTNLLALNAAIEAARAGEQGRGFAVVADEVRKLAERTALSTQQISEVIGKTESYTREAMGCIETVVVKMGGVDKLSHEVGTEISQIASQSGVVVDAVAEITNALQEQSTASMEIARGLEQVAQMSEENSGAVRQTSEAAQALEGVAARLQETAHRFRL